MNKLTGFPAANSRFSAAGALSLLAGAGLLVASGISFQSLSKSNPVTIDLRGWQSLSVAQLGFSSGDGLQEAVILAHQEVDSVSAPVPFRPVMTSAQLKAMAPRVVGRKSISLAPTRAAVLVTTDQGDQLAVAQAAPVSANIETPAVLDSSATQETLESFQQMHRDLTRQFHVVLSGKFVMDTQVVTHVSPAPAAPVKVEVSSKVSVAPKTAKAIKRPARKAYRASVTKFNAQPTPALPVMDMAKLEETYRQIEQISERVFASSPEPIQVEPASAATPVRVAEKPVLQERSTPALTPVMSQAPVTNPVPVIVAAAEAPRVEPTQAPVVQADMTTHSLTQAPGDRTVVQKSPTTGGTVLVSGGDYSVASAGKAQGDYSSLNLYKLWQAWNARNQGAPGPAIHVADANRRQDSATDADRTVVPAPAAVVEAFNWRIPVQNTTTDVISLEGWKRVESADHWPVIYWNPDGLSQAAMISNNVAAWLANLAETQLQQDAAIVFGKIPAGWDVEYSDRAEKAIYTDELNRGEARSDEARYFAFVNAAPGAQVVTLRAVLGAETASVVVPVMDGASTYLDLGAVNQREAFNGYVLDASARTRKGLSGAIVTIVGNPNAVFFTTESGYFQLSDIHTIGSYPVYVETSTPETVQPQGFKHRYRLSPDQMTGVDLFRMSDAQIQSWISQLEGGVSPASGLIVAAMPGMTRSYGDGRLFPSTHTLLDNRTLKPETYALSNTGALDPGKPLEAVSPRFVSVQVPAGPVVSQVEDNNRNVIWSQLVFAQPGVVNVIGPY